MKRGLIRITSLLLVLTLALSLGACAAGEVGYTETVSQSQTSSETQSESDGSVEISVDYDDDDLDTDWDSSEVLVITLEGDSISFDGREAIVEGSVITIAAAGDYVISGTLDDGQIVVKTPDEETVRLILNGVDITCSTSAPIYVDTAEKVVITLAEGTENYVTDGTSYVFEDEEEDEPNAAIFSHDDLTINGSGSLTVNANYNNGIQSKDDLIITGGDITVNAVNDGIKGRDSVAIKDGNITIDAGGDGIQSNNDEDTSEGYVVIEGGTIDITAGEDGIQAETSLVVSGGDITVFTAGGSTSVSHTTEEMMGGGGMMGGWDMDNTGDGTADDGSYKGLKAGVSLTVTGGTIDIDSADDALHSDDTMTVGGGTLVLASGDDGMHADSSLTINGGDITVSQCYEGLESGVITINDGNIYIVASDDGINVVGDNDGSFVGGRPTEGDTGALSDNYLYINGGYTVVDAGGDGLDINGSVEMTDGVVIVNGPTSDTNSAIDYYTTFKISGGLLIAAGSSGMAMAPSANSSQCSVMITFDSQQAAGTMVHIESEDGQEILTFVPTKAYETLVLCSPELENGSTYLVYLEGSSSGTETDGLYSGGSYSPGSQYTSFSIADVVTTIGSGGGGITGGGGGGGNFPGGGGGGRR